LHIDKILFGRKSMRTGVLLHHDAVAADLMEKGYGVNVHAASGLAAAE
jgi:hypothetical protein